MGRRLALTALLLLAACHRTPLGFVGFPSDAGAVGQEAATPTPDAAPDVTLLPDLLLAPDLSAAQDAAADPPAPSDQPPVPPPPIVPGCQPQPEVCNGRDDDCDGQIDEDLPPVPCPNGGNRYCVAGRLSECPRVCEVCRPGSQRVCFISYCTYWGAQSCASDGRSFGLCHEGTVPPECKSIASSKKRSPELERCCIDNGYCCKDEYDLDGDGDRDEMLGRCGGVTCPP